MSEKKAADFLPAELIELIQSYVDGESIYIPRKQENRKKWGSQTSTRRELAARNARIYHDYCSGISVETLGRRYFLSFKSIQRIIRDEKKRK